MTGFARADGHHEAWSWTWEVKSVNGRTLDVRAKLPSECDTLEPAVRALVQGRFKRGSVSVALPLTRAAGSLRLRLNPEVADQVEAIAAELAARVEAAPPRLDGLLGIRGLIEVADEEESPETREARDAAIMASLDQALAALAAARIEEGTRLAAVLADQLGALERLSEQAGACAGLQPEAIRARLAEQVAALLEAAPALPEERLAQEAALLAAKADIREELDRLEAHLGSARELLDGAAAEGEGGPVGRRLDFLCQELNREANTICAKSADIALTRIGLEIKTVVEQLREQVQNIE